MIGVLPGQNARLNWTFVGDPTLSTQTWYLTGRSAGSNKEEAIVYNHCAYSADIFNSSLPGVAVENPATLV